MSARSRGASARAPSIRQFSVCRALPFRDIFSEDVTASVFAGHAGAGAVLAGPTLRRCAAPPQAADWAAVESATRFHLAYLATSSTFAFTCALSSVFDASATLVLHGAFQLWNLTSTPFLRALAPIEVVLELHHCHPRRRAPRVQRPPARARPPAALVPRGGRASCPPACSSCATSSGARRCATCGEWRRRQRRARRHLPGHARLRPAYWAYADFTRAAGGAARLDVEAVGVSCLRCPRPQLVWGARFLVMRVPVWKARLATRPRRPSARAAAA